MTKRTDHNQVFDTQGNLISEEVVEVIVYPTEEESFKAAARLVVLPLIAADELKDEAAEQFAGLFPDWEPDIPVQAGWVYRWDGTLVECIQGHTTQSDWTPDVASSLWKIHRTPEAQPWSQPQGAHDAYNIGDKVLWTDGFIYESLIDANVWSPQGYPAGWRKV